VHPDDVPGKNLPRRPSPNGIHHGGTGDAYLKALFLLLQLFEFFLQKSLFLGGFLSGFLLLEEGGAKKLGKLLQLLFLYIRKNADEDDTVALGSLVEMVLELMTYHCIRIIPTKLYHPELIRAVAPKTLNIEIVLGRGRFLGEALDILEHGSKRDLILHGDPELLGIPLPGGKSAETSLGEDSRIEKSFVSLGMTDEHVPPKGLVYIIFCGLEVYGF
jgi:hypothetical protein